jgi:hypothetical protein
MSASKYGLTTNCRCDDAKPRLCCCLHVFALWDAAIDAWRGIVVGENIREVSTRAKDFMVARVHRSISFAKGTCSSTVPARYSDRVCEK